MRWLVLAVCALGIGACAPAPTHTSDTVWVAPDFALTGLEGQDIRLSDQRGRWVILTFWATWCAPCAEELPALQTLYQQGKVEVIAINMRESQAEVRSFTDHLGLTYPIALDPDDATVLAYAVTGLPQTIVITPDGTVAWRGFGAGLPPALWENSD